MPVQGEHICAIQGSAVAGPHLGAPTGMQSRISSAAHRSVTQNQDWNDTRYTTWQQFPLDHKVQGSLERKATQWQGTLSGYAGVQ